MLVPLGLSRGKIDYYLLPLLPPLSLAVGACFAGSWQRWERVWGRVALAALASAILALALWPPSLPAAWLPRPLVVRVAAAAAVAAGIACLAAAWRARPLESLAVVAGAAAGFYLAIAAAFLPAFASGQPYAPLLEDVRRELAYEPRAAVVVCGDPGRVQRALLFEARLRVEERCDLWAAASAAAPRLFLLHGEERKSVGVVLRPISIHRFLPADTLTLRGLFSRPQPEVVKLSANFATGDPVAVRKAVRAHQQRERLRRMRRLARERAARP
jgi:hypothetical protein